MRGTPSSLGADGTLYTTHCSPVDGGTSTVTVTAYSPTLDELWAIDIGSPCSYSGTALADDGVLYFARNETSRLEIIAIQTASPGLAPTAWPTHFHDNRRTGWLSAP